MIYLTFSKYFFDALNLILKDKHLKEDDIRQQIVRKMTIGLLKIKSSIQNHFKYYSIF